MPLNFWVASSATDTGKTTVATGALRALTRLGFSSMGFKPFSAEDLVVHLGKYHAITDSRLPVDDGKKLAEASSAISGEHAAEMMEVVNPKKFVILSSPKLVILLRVGSPVTANERMVRSDEDYGALARPDVSSLLAKIDIWDRLHESAPENISLFKHHSLFTEETAKCYEHLMSMNPTAVVSEGAAGFLPVWQGQPSPDYIIVVDTGNVGIISTAEIDLSALQNQEYGPRLDSLLQLRQVAPLSSKKVELPLVTSDKRDEVVTDLMEDLLKEVGIKGPE
jgi:hypothetical protein